MVTCIWIIGGVKHKILSANLFPTSKCIYLICLCLHPLSLMIGSCPLVFQTVKFFVFEHQGSPSEHPTYQDENKLLPALIFIIEYNEWYKNPYTYRQRISYLSCIDSRHSEISFLYPTSSFAVMFVMIFSAAISRLSRDFCLISLSAWMICNRDRILRLLLS